MSSAQFDPAETQRTGCPSCGGALRFDIASQTMVCAQCGNRVKTEQLQYEPPEEKTIEATAYRCPQCGAEIYTDSETEATGHCIFCGSDVVLTGRLARLQCPEKLAPFRITREECGAIYRKYLRKYPLTSALLKRKKVAEAFQPVYVPFWSYRITAEGKTNGYVGYRKEDLPREVIHTKCDISAEVYLEDDCPAIYDACRELEDETAHRLQFSTEKCVPFHPGYLGGFYAQAPNVEPETYQEDAGAFISVRLMKHLQRVFYDEISGVDVENHVKNWGLPQPRAEAHLVMLPVWLLTRRNGGRVLYTAINGITGTIVCDPPVSHLRVAVLMLFLAAAFFLPLQNLLNLKPDLLASIFALVAIPFQFVLTARTQPGGQKDGKPPTPSEGELYMKAVKAPVRGESFTFSDEYSEKLTEDPNIIVTLLLFIALILFTLYIGNIWDFFTSLPNYTLLPLVSLFWLWVLHRLFVKPRGIQAVFRWLLVVALVVLMGFYLTRQIEDALYYGWAVVLLLISVIPILVLNIRHNAYVTRPVPFFHEEGDAS